MSKEQEKRSSDEDTAQAAYQGEGRPGSDQRAKNRQRVSNRVGVHPTQIAQWKKQAIDELSGLFGQQAGRKEKEQEARIVSL
jgi:transposase-like protein